MDILPKLTARLKAQRDVEIKHGLFSRWLCTTLVSVLLISGCSIMPAQFNHMFSSGDLMKIDLQVAPNQVTLIFENTSSQDIRLWELKNSWGWFAPRFEIQAADGKKAATRISHTENMVWTRDVPSYFIVPAKGTYKLVIPLNDGQWDVSGELPSSSQKARVRAIYHVDTTPESEEYHVFTGTIESNWVQLEPPYTWLPTVSKKK